MTLDMQFKIAKNLKALRKAKKLSQQALAEKMSICRSGYCQYNKGTGCRTWLSCSSYHNFIISKSTR